MKLSSLLAQTESDMLFESTTNQGTDAVLGLGILLVIFLLFIGFYALNAWLLSRIFKKAGVEPWRAWVPIYSSWKMLEIGGQKGFWAVLALVPLVGLVSAVFLIIAMYRIGLSLGKSGTFVLLAIFLPIVWLAWLAFDDSTWNGPEVADDTSASNPTNPIAALAPTPNNEPTNEVAAPSVDEQKTDEQPAQNPDQYNQTAIVPPVQDQDKDRSV